MNSTFAIITLALVVLYGCTKPNAIPLSPPAKSSGSSTAGGSLAHSPTDVALHRAERELICAEAFNFERDLANGELTLKEFGLVKESEVDAANEIGTEYGVSIHPLGCVVTKYEDDCAEMYNQKVIQYMTARHGINWLSRFRERRDSARKAYRGLRW